MLAATARLATSRGYFQWLPNLKKEPWQEGRAGAAAEEGCGEQHDSTVLPLVIQKRLILWKTWVWHLLRCAQCLWCMLLLLSGKRVVFLALVLFYCSLLLVLFYCSLVAWKNISVSYFVLSADVRRGELGTHSSLGAWGGALSLCVQGVGCVLFCFCHSGCSCTILAVRRGGCTPAHASVCRSAINLQEETSFLKAKTLTWG